jgi:glycosyltransferase involved in cell wall biosynthesis
MKPDEPAVSVVIAAYNPGYYLKEAVDGLLAQTYDLWDCVVVDDGSDEDLSWVAAVDRRVRLVRQSNSGTSAARNAGIRATSAPIVAFLDQDDLWYPDYLRRQLAAFEAVGDVVLASTGFEIISESGALLEPGFVGHNSSYEELLRGCGLQLSTVMVRRTALDKVGLFRPFRISQDWDLWLRIAREGGTLARTDDVLGAWRKHGSNQSQDYRGLLSDARQILAEHDHPAAKVGLRRIRNLSGAQAFETARHADRPSRELITALAWALSHAPVYVARNVIFRGGRDRRPGA